MKYHNFLGILIFLILLPLQIDAQDLNTEVVKLKLKVSSLQEEMDGVKSLVEASNDENSKLSKQIKNLTSRVDKIESSIDEILKILSSNSTPKKKTVKKDRKKEEKNRIKKLSGRELFNKGYNLYKQKKYSQGRNFLLDAAEKKYKEASSYFYIAESLYYQKRYDEAIVYYKKSIYKYDKPKYLSTLLLHTGISLFKTGDKVGAEKFLNATIEGFPKSKNAHIAKKFLKKL